MGALNLGPSPDLVELDPSAPASRSSVRLLVIEDEAIVARHIVSLLGKRGFTEVARAASGEDAVRLGVEFKPDLVLADIHLRGTMDGVEAVAGIREVHDPVVVFLTAYSDDTTLARAMATNPGGYVVKPFTERSLSCAVEVALARQTAERAVKAASMHDDLTGLYNRRAFRTLAEHQLKIASRYGRNTALFFFDLDGLKRINDRLGHAAGDAAIIDVAAVLKATFRESDLVARLAGDEFVALAVDCSYLAAEGLRDRVNVALAERSAVSPRAYPLGLSIGMAVAEVPSTESLAELLARADEAMYADKRRRREGPAR